jgi:ankyrin repeat protein
MPIKYLMVSRFYVHVIFLLLLFPFQVFSQKAPAAGELPAAVSEGDKSLIETLLLRGADPDQPNSRGETALLYAVQSGENSLVKRILDSGADPDKPGAENLTALMFSVIISREDLVVLLISGGADPNLIMDLGGPEGFPVSALSLALNRGEYDIARFLLSSGADPFLLRNPAAGSPDPLDLPVLKVPVDAEMWRAVAEVADFAGASGKSEWRELRDELDNGLPVDSRNLQNTTLLMAAAWYGDAAAVSLLLQRGADTALRDVNGRNALCYAAAAGETTVIRMLTENTDIPELKSFSSVETGKGGLSQSPLYYAVVRRDHPSLNLLLNAGTDRNVIFSGTDGEGVTLLMIAAWLGDLYAVERLLPLSDGSRMDDAGRRALDWCAAAFERDRNTGRQIGCPDRGSRNYPLARLLAGRLRNPEIYKTQPTTDLDPAVINAWSPGHVPGYQDNADDWRDKRPSPVPRIPGDGDLTLYRIFRDEEPGIPGPK